MPTVEPSEPTPFLKRQPTWRGLIGVALVVFVLSALIPMATIFVTQSSIEDQADRTEQLSLANCSTVNKNTTQLVGLVDILGQIVAGGALGPKAVINVEEPRLNVCKGKNAGKLTPKKKHPEKRTYTAPADAPPLPNPQK